MFLRGFRLHANVQHAGRANRRVPPCVCGTVPRARAPPGREKMRIARARVESMGVTSRVDHSSASLY